MRQHLGEKMCEQIGSFKRSIGVVDNSFDRAKALDALEHWQDHQRIDFISCKSEEEAKGIIASLKAR
jgi:hypothetical protein